MLNTPPPATRFYRVTEWETSWQEVLSGEGAYFSTGGRYNRPQQRTVYTADDPLVAITELAFYQALNWQAAIGEGILISPPLPPPPLPFVSGHALWCFTLQTPPQVIDLEDPAAQHVFRHRPAAPFNPAQAYRHTADLADAIRRYPNPSKPLAGGLRAPSVRTPPVGDFQPYQYAFFVPHNRRRLGGTLLRRWKLTLEFKDHENQPVTAQTQRINWSQPWFRLTGSRAAIPAFLARPGAQVYTPGLWYQIAVLFA